MGAPKSEKSAKHQPSMWEWVDAMHTIVNNSSPGVPCKVLHNSKWKKVVPFIDDFSDKLHEYIVCIVDVKLDKICSY